MAKNKKRIQKSSSVISIFIEKIFKIAVFFFKQVAKWGIF